MPEVIEKYEGIELHETFVPDSDFEQYVFCAIACANDDQDSILRDAFPEIYQKYLEKEALKKYREEHPANFGHSTATNLT